MKTTKILFITALIFLNISLKAQTWTGLVSLPTQVSTCQNFTIGFDNIIPPSQGWQLQNFTINVRVFIATSGTTSYPYSSGYPTCPDATQKQPVIVNSATVGANNPTITLNNTVPIFNSSQNTFDFNFTNTGSLPNLNTINGFVFELQTGCSFLPLTNNQELIVQLFYSDQNVNMVSINNAQNFNYCCPQIPVVTPNLVAVTNSNPNVFSIQAINSGASQQDWYFSYQNTGNGDASNVVINEFNISSCASYSQIGIKYAVTSSSDPTLITNWLVFSPNTLENIPASFFIHFKFEAMITGCVKDCNPIPPSNPPVNATFKWSCASSVPTLYCTTCFQDQSNEVFFNSGISELEVNLLAPAPPQNIEDFQLCFYDPQTWKFEIKNTGSEILKDIKFIIDNPDQNSLAIIDPSIIVTSPSSYSIEVTNHTSALPLCNSSTLSPPKQIEIKNVVLKPSEICTVEFKVTYYPSDDFSLYSAEKIFNQITISAEGENSCGENALVDYTNSVMNSGSKKISGYGLASSILSQDDVKLNVTTATLPSYTTVYPPIGTPLPPPPTINYQDENTLFHSIEFLSIAGNNEDFQFFGNPASGIIKIELDCKEGLVIGNPKNISLAIPSPSSSPTNFVQLYPVCFTGFDCNTSIPYPSTSQTVSYQNLNIQSFEPIDMDNTFCKCDPRSYTLYFDLAGLQASGFSVQQLFTEGSLILGFNACCNVETAPSEYTVKISMIPNDACFSSSSSTCDYLWNSTNASCPIPLYQDTRSINVQCPGCLAPGIIIDHFYIERTTLGYEDPNNNGSTSLTPTPIIHYPRFASTSSPYSEYTNIDLGLATFKDNISEFISSHFQDGDNGSQGYEYSDMKESNGTQINLNYLQLYKKFALAGSSAYDIVVNKVELYIDDPNYTTQLPIDHDYFNVPSAFTRKTVAKYTITTPNLNSFLLEQDNGNDRFYLFTFYESDLNNSSAITKTFYTPINYVADFVPGQVYRIRIDYTINGNPYSTISPGYIDEAKNDNILYLTGSPKNLAGFLINTMPNTVAQICGFTNTCLFNTLFTPCTTSCSIPLNQPATQGSLGDPFLFYCEGGGGSINLISNKISNSTSYSYNFDPENTDCAAKIKVKSLSEFEIGQKVFNYEIKVPPLIAESCTLNVPPGWTWNTDINNNVLADLTSFNCNLFQSFCTSYSTAISFPNTGNLNFNYSSFGPFTCSTNGTQHFYSDEIAAHEIIFSLSPSPNCQPDNIVIDPSESKIKFKPWSCITSSFAANPEFELDNDLSAQYRQIIPPDPDLNVQLSPVSYIANSNTLRWNFSITNQATAQFPTDAKNPFVTLSDPSLLNLGTWKTRYCLNTGFSSCLPVDQFTVPANSSSGYMWLMPALNSNNVLENWLPVSETIYGVIECELSAPVNCSISNPIHFVFGWDCGENPTTPFPASQSELCYYEERQSSITFNTGSLVSLGAQATPNTYAACSTQTIDVVYTFINNLSGTSAIVPTGYSLQVPGNITISLTPPVFNNQCSGGSGSLAAPNYTINQTSSTSGTFECNAQPPINCGYVDVGECFTITAQITNVDCNVGNLPLPTLTIFYNDLCGEPSQCTNTPSPIPPSQGQSNCTDCFILNKYPASSPAIVGEPFTWNIDICANNNPSFTAANLEEIYPLNFIPVNPSSNQFTVNNILPQGCTTITVLGAFDDVGECATVINTVQQQSNPAISSSACVDVTCPSTVNYISISSDADAALFFAGNASPVVGANIYVADYYSFVFVSSYTFDNCTFLMGSGSQLYVSNGSALYLKNSNISSCPYMWKGIELESNAKLLTNETTIADAENGVLANIGSSQSIVNTNFYNCVTGITNFPNSGGMYPIGFEVYDSKFGKTGLILKKEYLGQNPHGQIGFAGISFIDIENVKIGNEMELANEFFNCNYGIKLVNTNAIITNNHFVDIRADYSYKFDPIDQLGVAIHADNIDYLEPAASLAISPLSAGTTTIEKCDIGLFNRRYDMRMDRVKMEDVEVGVRATQNGLCTNSITSCEIHSNRTGVLWYDNNQAIEMLFTDGRIYNKGKFGCIELHELEVNNNANYRILNNPYIEALMGGRGIVSNGVSDAQIGYNNIFTKDPHQSTSMPVGIGININAGNTNSVFCNTTGTDMPHTNFGSIGLSVSLSDFNTIYCNHLNSATIGARFGGLCNSTRYRGNAMQNNGEGLHLDNSAIIGDQVHHGNLWANYSLPVGAVNDNTGFEYLSEFIVHNTGLPFYPVANPLSGWFAPDPGSPFNCNTSFSCLSAEPEPDPIERTSLDSLIATDSLQFLVYNEETRNIARERLLERIQWDTSQYLSDAIFSDFYTEVLNSPTGEINNIGLQLTQALEISPISYSTLLLTDSLIQQTVDSMYILDSINRIQSHPNNDVIRAQLSMQLNNLRGVATSILTARAANLGLIRDSLLLLNAGIQPTELPDINRRTVLEIVIRYHEEGSTVLVAEYNTLLSIAQQCPYEGGAAVYTARSLLRIINDSIEYFDDIVCLQAGYYRAKSDEVKINQGIKIIPNPANSIVEIYSYKVNDNGGEIRIYNSIGECVYLAKTEIGVKLKSISTTNLSPGVYTINTSFGECFYTDKLIIIR